MWIEHNAQTGEAENYGALPTQVHLKVSRLLPSFLGRERLEETWSAETDSQTAGQPTIEMLTCATGHVPTSSCRGGIALTHGMRHTRGGSNAMQTTTNSPKKCEPSNDLNHGNGMPLHTSEPRLWGHMKLASWGSSADDFRMPKGILMVGTSAYRRTPTSKRRATRVAPRTGKRSPSNLAYQSVSSAREGTR
eukprot:6473630-Amphidinium_carterae.1